MQPPPWRIILLGGLELHRGDHVITHFRTQKTGALMAYLALYRQRSHSREMLATLFWPDDPEDAARKSLRVALSSLRSQLEPPGLPSHSVLWADRTHIGLVKEMSKTDVEAFETALVPIPTEEDPGEREQDNPGAEITFLEEALHLYSGPLLPGCYEDWALRERERLEDLYLTGLRRLVKALVQVREYDRALVHAQQAVNTDPLREGTHRDLMRLYAAVGRPVAALELYDRFELALKQELNVAPSETIRRLAEELRSRHSLDRPAGHPMPSTATVPRDVNNAPALPITNVQASYAPPGRRTPTFPLQLTRFFGRLEEKQRLERLLTPASDGPRARLATLTGTGGIGKTRLSVETAQSLRPAYQERVWFVPLADLREPQTVLPAVRDALGLSRTPNMEPGEQIAGFLGSAPALLILDNFEQLQPRGAQVVHSLLQQSPNLACLVTSRIRLALPGERLIPLSPLRVPDASDRSVRPLSPDLFAELPGAQMLLDRWQAVQPDFEIDSANQAAFLELCRCLEGVPLALELAAARARTLTPTDMTARLRERFHLLARQSHTEPDNGQDPDCISARHRSLQAAMDWSYTLLSPALRRTFARLSVFRGGWMLEAAEAVVSDPLPVDSTEKEDSALSTRHSALDLLDMLVGHSLVIAEPQPMNRGMRFRLLESLREYAAERLRQEFSEDEASLIRRHANYYLDFAERIKPTLRGPNQRNGVETLEGEIENLRAVFERSEAAGDSMGVRLGSRMEKFWEISGLLDEGRDRLLRALKHSSSSEIDLSARMDVLIMAGHLAESQGDSSEADRLLAEGLELAREQNRPEAIAAALHWLGKSLFTQHDFLRAKELLEEALTLWHTCGDDVGASQTLNLLGLLARRYYHDDTRALLLFEESLRLARKAGELRYASYTLYNIALMYKEQGDLDQASHLIREVLTMSEANGDKWFRSYAMNALATIAEDHGRLAEAEQFYRESLRLSREPGDRLITATSLWGLAEVAEMRGDLPRAVLMSAASEALYAHIGLPLSKEEIRHLDAREARLMAASPTLSETTGLRARGRAFTLEQMFAAALEAPSPTASHE